MKKLLAAVAALAISAGSLWAESFFQGGFSLGTNIAQINEYHSLEANLDGFYLGYRGYHTLQILEQDDEDGNPMPNRNYDRYVPVVFLGFHADKFYFNVGGQLTRMFWLNYNSNLSLPIAYPTVSIGWDARLWQNYPHNLILNIDMTWYYCDLGDSYNGWENGWWMFVPKFSLGLKYRFNFGQD